MPTVVCGHRKNLKYIPKIFFLTSLLASEGGIAVCAYLFSYECFLKHSSLRNLVIRLFPYFCLVIIWRYFYNFFGFGVSATKLYVDPAKAPVQFLILIIQRLPYLANDLFFWPKADIFLLLSAKNTFFVSGLFALLVFTFLVLFFPMLKQNSSSRFFLCASLLSLIPACSSFPQSKNLVFANIGAMALITQFIAYIFDISFKKSSKPFLKPVYWTTVILFLFIHIFKSTQYIYYDSTKNQNPSFLPKKEVSKSLSSQDLILVNPPSSFLIACMIPWRLYQGLPVPAHTRSLAVGTTPIVINRTDERTLVVRPYGGYLREAGTKPNNFTRIKNALNLTNAVDYFESTFWDTTDSLKMNQTIMLTGVNIEITDLTSDGRPAEATFRFNKPLEDESLIWLQWDWNKMEYKPFNLPAVNNRVMLTSFGWRFW